MAKITPKGINTLILAVAIVLYLVVVLVYVPEKWRAAFTNSLVSVIFLAEVIWLWRQPIWSKLRRMGQVIVLLAALFMLVYSIYSVIWTICFAGDSLESRWETQFPLLSIFYMLCMIIGNPIAISKFTKQPPQEGQPC